MRPSFFVQRNINTYIIACNSTYIKNTKNMSHRDLLLRLIQFSDQYNVNQKDVVSLPVKALILSLKYVNRQNLFSSLFPYDFADWDLAERTLGANSNTLGDAETWLTLLGLLDWPQLTEKHRVEIETQHPPLALIKSNLKAHNLDSPGWGTACRVFILQLIQGLQSMHAIELLTTRMLARNTHEATMKLLAALYDTKHLPEEYLKTLYFILCQENLAIDAATLTSTLSIINAQKEEHKLNMKLRSMQMLALRPRLRDRLKTSLLTEQSKEQVDSQSGTWDSYNGFRHIHRFPNTLSDRVTRQLYFLAAQTRWNWGECIPYLLDNAEIEERVKQHPVLQADIEILNWVINNLSMDGRQPFKEMMAFKARCFASFPVVHVQRMTLTQILRLYVSAYQAANVWKDVWKTQIGVISPQIVRDCEAFVDSNAFAVTNIAMALSGRSGNEVNQ